MKSKGAFFVILLLTSIEVTRSSVQIAGITFWVAFFENVLLFMGYGIICLLLEKTIKGSHGILVRIINSSLQVLLFPLTIILSIIVIGKKTIFEATCSVGVEGCVVIIIVLLIYVLYRVLRSDISEDERKSKLS
jgi:hypothetical protein